jgi:hypothetical protein
MPAGRVGPEGLVLPAKRLRRAGGDLCVTLAVMVFIFVLEVVSVGAVLLADGDLASMGIPGVAGYAVLPVVAGVLTLPLLIRSWRQPELRIDATGISKMLRHRVEAAPWEILDAVQFTQNRSFLVLVVRAGATFPGKGSVQNCPTPVPYYGVGNSLRRRQRRRHHDLIVTAVEHFAPGVHSDEPFHIRKARTTAGRERHSPSPIRSTPSPCPTCPRRDPHGTRRIRKPW